MAPDLGARENPVGRVTVGGSGLACSGPGRLKQESVHYLPRILPPSVHEKHTEFTETLGNSAFEADVSVIMVHMHRGLYSPLFPVRRVLRASSHLTLKTIL